MNLTYTAEQRAFRAEVRAWMAANVPAHPLPSFDLTREGFEAHRDWERKLNEGRWGMVTWPEKLGGRDLDYTRWLIFEEEYYRAKAPTRVNQNGIFLLGPTLMEYGTPEQKTKFMPRMISAEDLWCLRAVRAPSQPGDADKLGGHRCRAGCEGSGRGRARNGVAAGRARPLTASSRCLLLRVYEPVLSGISKRLHRRICTDVCPHYHKFSRPVTEPAFNPQASFVSPSLEAWGARS